MTIPTALQVAMKRADSIISIIPVMDHPLSKHWSQPNRNLIEIDDTHASMSQSTFESLKEYSCSDPSGVYPGKMWKRNNGVYDPQFLAGGGKPYWCLCWYDVSEKGDDWCSTKLRRIVIV